VEAVKWFHCIDVATDRGRAAPRDILAVARELYPEELRQDEDAAADRGHLRALADATRRILDPEETGEGPKSQLDLPGLPAPAYISGHSDLGPKPIIKYANAVRSDLTAYVETKVALVRRTNVRIRDQRIKNQFLFPFMPDDSVTVQQAIELSRKAQKRRKRA
jgi:hypothetical protein